MPNCEEKVSFTAESEKAPAAPPRVYGIQMLRLPLSRENAVVIEFEKMPGQQELEHLTDFFYKLQKIWEQPTGD